MSVSSKQYILALDVGTTSVRAIVFDRYLKQIAVAQKPLKVTHPEPGWVETDALELWKASRYVMRAALKQKKLKPGQIASIGITNQRETTAIWDEAGIPIGPAIVWQDRRTATVCERLKRDGREPDIRKKTGLVIDPYFSATKAQWLLKKKLGKKNKKNLKFGTVDSWLVWNLTGGEVHVTDVTNASRTMLYDIRKLKWDQDLVRLFGLTESMLPQVVASSGQIGQTEKGVLGESVPITGICGDQQAALFGQACFKKGEMKNTYGTGAFLVLNTGARPVFPREPLLTTIAWQIDGKVTYALEGSVFNCGTVINWLMDMTGVQKPKDADQLVESLPDNDDVWFVPALTGLGAPYWDAEARGTFFGLTSATTKAHLLRAGWEGIAHSVTDVLETMQKVSGVQPLIIKVDGGVARGNFIMQTQADLIGVPVVRSQTLETTAVGVAMLAGLAVKYWPSQESLKRLVKTETKYLPKLKLTEQRSVRNKWLKAIELTRKWS